MMHSVGYFGLPVMPATCITISEIVSGSSEQIFPETFLQSLHDCRVCLSENTGRSLLQLPCHHLFCLMCLKSNCRIHVIEGNLTQVWLREDAVAYFKNMFDGGLRPTSNAFNKVIDGWVKVDMLNEAHGFFDMMPQKDIDDVTVVIFYFGGQHVGWEMKTEWLSNGWLCLVCGASDTQELPLHFIKLAKDTYTSDCMFEKIGYGTVSEALVYMLSLLFVRRDYCNEEPFFRNVLEHCQCGIEMIRRDLFTGHWKHYLQGAIPLQPCFDGLINVGKVAARTLQDTVVGNSCIVSRQPPWPPPTRHHFRTMHAETVANWNHLFSWCFANSDLGELLTLNCPADRAMVLLMYQIELRLLNWAWADECVFNLCLLRLHSAVHSSLANAYKSWLITVIHRTHPIGQDHVWHNVDRGVVCGIKDRCCARLAKLVLSATLTQDSGKLSQLELHHPLLLNTQSSGLRTSRISSGGECQHIIFSSSQRW
uniref:RING-type domain-containing protein n=2 Tax=Zea mays TaxID=4577 RepID=B4FKF6_MAIZE|nr:unknown [Zea mays]